MSDTSVFFPVIFVLRWNAPIVPIVGYISFTSECKNCKKLQLPKKVGP